MLIPATSPTAAYDKYSSFLRTIIAGARRRMEVLQSNYTLQLLPELELLFLASVANVSKMKPVRARGPGLPGHGGSCERRPVPHTSCAASRRGSGVAQGTIVHAEGDEVRSISVLMHGVVNITCVHVPPEPEVPESPLRQYVTVYCAVHPWLRVCLAGGDPGTPLRLARTHRLLACRWWCKPRTRRRADRMPGGMLPPRSPKPAPKPKSATDGMFGSKTGGVLTLELVRGPALLGEAEVVRHTMLGVPRDEDGRIRRCVSATVAGSSAATIAMFNWHLFNNVVCQNAVRRARPHHPRAYPHARAYCLER